MNRKMFHFCCKNVKNAICLSSKIPFDFFYVLSVILLKMGEKVEKKGSCHLQLSSFKVLWPLNTRKSQFYSWSTNHFSDLEKM